MKKNRNQLKTEKYSRLSNFFIERHGYARTSNLVEKGIHQRDIKMLLSEGKLIKIKNGLFRFADKPMIANQGFADVSTAIPWGVICLISALSYFDLTTFNPSVISVAIHRKSWKPHLDYPPVDIYYFSGQQFEAGIKEIEIGGIKVSIYCKEKTICDCFRYRNKLGLDIAKEGLTEYLRLKDRNLEKLLYYAAICHVKSLLETWLHALV